MKDTVIKPVIWVGSSKNDMYKMSSSVKSTFGYALYQAQKGEHPDIAKVLSGFGGASVIELIEDDRGDTFRAVYTVKFPSAIFVLHVFQKKSKKGISTPKKEMDLIASRLKIAETMYKEWKLQRGIKK